MLLPSSMLKIFSGSDWSVKAKTPLLYISMKHTSWSSASMFGLWFPWEQWSTWDIKKCTCSCLAISSVPLKETWMQSPHQRADFEATLETVHTGWIQGAFGRTAAVVASTHFLHYGSQVLYHERQHPPPPAKMDPDCGFLLATSGAYLSWVIPQSMDSHPCYNAHK